ncbi:phosphatidate cytidylyltransferase [Candidatus Pelagibacter sp. RS40]|uniref:phosphatidate cytidylyltransferase n=1 Tax=Candidatus Pelagibacter sp. RS40 TaxID=1977865 RepID=UPI000A164166|nr:phosphatidate cytidylyltransferase [Candidatus Pelagibacter sp. RS40]ARJ48504.1 hypothetical protein B8063_00280 [Candidatus Pelagibacter sp. RS40]
MKFNFLKRCFTGVILFIIIYISLTNNLILFLLFIAITFIALTEVNNLLKNIYKNKIFYFCFYLLCVTYLTIFLSQIFFFIISNSGNKLLFIFFLSICISTDLGGYFIGKLFQGKKLTKISPNKTYSGLIGSYLFTLITFIYFYYQFNYPLNFIFVALFVSTISQIGDLFVSYIKRRANVKDTGYFLPGHGGILDRVDGIIFAIPISINFHFIFI